VTADYLSQMNRMFPSGFPTKILYAFVILNCVICIPHQIQVE
jgi:hypothetical protein